MLKIKTEVVIIKINNHKVKNKGQMGIWQNKSKTDADCTSDMRKTS